MQPLPLEIVLRFYAGGVLRHPAALACAIEGVIVNVKGEVDFSDERLGENSRGVLDLR